MKKKKVLFGCSLALIGILLLCASVFIYATDAWAAIEGFESFMRIKQLIYQSIG
jgi:hypothetical protein